VSGDGDGDGDDVIALEHQPVAVNVDLALAVDQSRRWCTKPGNDLLTTQNVVAVALF
jgi:putative salt-induced outer membrane protein YdiY